MIMDNRYLTCMYEGKKQKKNYNEWSAITGVAASTIQTRVKRRAINHTDEMCAGLVPLVRPPKSPTKYTVRKDKSLATIAKQQKAFDLRAQFHRCKLVNASDDVN